jgi:hypothetical protein
MEIANAHVAAHQPTRPRARSSNIISVPEGQSWIMRRHNKPKGHGENRTFTQPIPTPRRRGLSDAPRVSFATDPVIYDPSGLPTEGLREPRGESDAVPASSQSSTSKPTRILSMFSGFRETKGVVFSEPWNELDSTFFQPYIDPLVALQSTRSFVHHNPTTPIPCSFNSGLLKLFEDYRHLKYEIERLEGELASAVRKNKDDQRCWKDERAQMNTEMRHLEGIIARSESGTAG